MLDTRHKLYGELVMLTLQLTGAPSKLWLLTTVQYIPTFKPVDFHHWHCLQTTPSVEWRQNVSALKMSQLAYEFLPILLYSLLKSVLNNKLSQPALPQRQFITNFSRWRQHTSNSARQGLVTTSQLATSEAEHHNLQKQLSIKVNKKMASMIGSDNSSRCHQKRTSTPRTKWHKS